MQLTTQINLTFGQAPVDYSSQLVLLGSCFAQNIGEKFAYYQFQNTVNPFGIIFNPVSIQRLIQRAVADERFTAEDLFYHNERWQCFEFHSEMSQSNAHEMLGQINLVLEQFRQDLQKATHIVITLGTAWVYRHLASQQIVANCHKVSQSEFKKELLSTGQIQQSIAEITSKVRDLNPNVQFIFTISPVRHLKDGFVENQRSKAHLISALHDFLAHDNNANYFPAYEIMMDELRDYRFYADDLLHPNPLAIKYIWQKWTSSHIHSGCYPLMEEVAYIRKALAHRPFQPNSESYQKFLAQLQLRIEKLRRDLGPISF